MSNGYIVDAKMGARFRPRIVDENGNVKEQGKWDSNLILNAAIEFMRDGFEEEPRPLLGSSMLDVAVDQEGVQAPLTGMSSTRARVIKEGEFTRVNDQTAYVSWITEYTYKNTSNISANVSEIGIDGFNRSVFKDDDGLARVWTVSPNENLIVEMEFRITFNAPTQPIDITTVDQDGEEIETIQCVSTVANKYADGKAEWWKLLSKPEHNVLLITDPDFTGITKPANPDHVTYANLASTYTYTARNIKIDIRHRAGVGGSDLKGLLVGFGCLAPAYGFVFSKTVRIGSGYTYGAAVNITW